MTVEPWDEDILDYEDYGMSELLDNFYVEVKKCLMKRWGLDTDTVYKVLEECDLEERMLACPYIAERDAPEMVAEEIVATVDL